MTIKYEFFVVSGAKPTAFGLTIVCSVWPSKFSFLFARRIWIKMACLHVADLSRLHVRLLESIMCIQLVSGYYMENMIENTWVSIRVNNLFK
jgi:hypothetical protein